MSLTNFILMNNVIISHHRWAEMNYINLSDLFHPKLINIIINITDNVIINKWMTQEYNQRWSKYIRVSRRNP
jgi:hypothetical protein